MVYKQFSTYPITDVVAGFAVKMSPFHITAGLDAILETSARIFKIMMKSSMV